MTGPDEGRTPGADDARSLRFGPDGGIPNHPDLPAVLIPGAMPEGTTAEAIRERYAANGWEGSWTGSVFTYHHYHPDAHEVLTVAAGWAKIRLGGPSGELLRVSAGDAMVLPAGVGHCREAASADFAICGGYPPGQADPVIARAGDLTSEDAQREIATVALPATDPLFGATGPLMALWVR